MRSSLPYHTIPYHIQLLGVCVARKPWLSVFEYAENNDVSSNLRVCKLSARFLRLNELLSLPVQVAQACKYLIEVCLVHDVNVTE